MDEIKQIKPGNTKKLLIILLCIAVIAGGYSFLKKQKEARELAADAARAAAKAAAEEQARQDAEEAKMNAAAAPPSEEQKRLMLEAAIKGDVQGVTAVLDENVSPDYPMDLSLIENYPLFRNQISSGTITKYMSPDAKYWTLVYIAVANTDNALLDELIKRRANLKIDGPKGESLIKMAIDSGNVVTIRTLLENGVPLNLNIADKNNPLNNAVKAKNVPMAKLFFQYAEKQNLDTAGFERDLFIALKNGDFEMSKLLLDITGFDLSQRFQNGFSPLELAVSSGNLELTKEIVFKGAPLNEPGKAGRTPVYFAAGGSASKNGLLKFLLQSGSKVNVADDKGITPLMLAIQRKDKEMAKLVMEDGADVSAAADDGTTALMEAVRINDAALTQELINAGAKAEMKTKAGQTPLMVAASRGNYALCKILLKAGASNRHRYNGERASDMAVQRGYMTVYDLLEKAK